MWVREQYGDGGESAATGMAKGIRSAFALPVRTFCIVKSCTVLSATGTRTVQSLVGRNSMSGAGLMGYSSLSSNQS